MRDYQSIIKVVKNLVLLGTLASVTLLIFYFSYKKLHYSADCMPTINYSSGNTYQPVTEPRVNVSHGVIVKGQVLVTPSCKPVPHARVAHWQTGEDGQYQDRLRGYLFTDENGRFEFETEWPKGYEVHPPHIHFAVTTDDYRPLETKWVGGHEKTSEIHYTMILDEKNWIWYTKQFVKTILFMN